MVCQTVKVGAECIFMKKTGCSYNGGRCYPIVESCKGCDRVATYEVGFLLQDLLRALCEMGKRSL